MSYMIASTHGLTSRITLGRKALAAALLTMLLTVLASAALAQAVYAPGSGGATNLSTAPQFNTALPKDDEAYSLVSVANGTSLVCAGYTKSMGNGGADMWLVKTLQSWFPSPPGTPSPIPSTLMNSVNWTKTYGGTQDDVAKCVIQASDGGYVLAGYTRSFGAGGSDMYLVKVDSDGGLIWNATYGGVQDDGANAVVQTSDGGYLLAGYTNSGVSTQTSWVVKTDASGTMQWNTIIPGQSVNGMVRTGDGGYALAVVNGGDFGLAKLSLTGQLLWNQTYTELGFSAEAKSLVQTSDGGFALAGCLTTAGTNSSSPWLVKTDASGNVQWDKALGGSLGVNSVIQTSEGGYALAGDRACLIITDATGNILWNRNNDGLSEDNLQFTRAYCIIEPSPNTFYMVGPQQSYGQILTGLDSWLWRETLRVVTDTTPPAIAVLAPENKIYTNASVPLTFTINKSAIWIGYAVDNGLNVTITGNTTINGLGDGWHNVTVYAADQDYNNGRSLTVSFQNFAVDTVPINITASIGQNATYSGASIPLTCSVNKQITSATYSLDGQQNRTLGENASLTGLTSGSHQVIVYAQDTLGLVGSSETIQFTVTDGATPSPSPSPTATPSTQPLVGPTFTPEPAPTATPQLYQTPPPAELQLPPYTAYVVVAIAAAAVAIAALTLARRKSETRA